MHYLKSGFLSLTVPDVIIVVKRIFLKKVAFGKSSNMYTSYEGYASI
jgi:hypothetical protein